MLLVAVGCSSYVQAESTECFKPGWPSDRSIIKPDPGLVRGTLNNGFRYVVMENDEPENRVAVYLYIQAGSINENDKQRGGAHYLEHMLFNGSTHFKPGELVTFFQEIGMTFGDDANAHTGYDRTVYQVDLPDGAEDNLRKGFLIVSDYARGALLLETEIERERGVILAEKRTRDSVRYRASEASRKFKYRGTLIPERPIIGVEETLEKMDRATLKEYYDNWYRPENMVLVVVGDIDTHAVLPVITEFFEPLKAEGSPPACYEFGSIDHPEIDAFYHYEKELGKTEVTIESIMEIDRVDDSVEARFEDLGRYVSMLIMQNRLEKYKEKNAEIFSDAGYFSDDMLQRVQTTMLYGVTEGKDWKTTLKQLDYQLRQAITFGFTEDELERVKKDLESYLESSVMTEDSRDSERLARLIIRHLSEDHVFLSPEQELALYTPMLERLTLESVNTEFRNAWKNGKRLISVVGNTGPEEGLSQKTILAEYKKVSAIEVAQIKESDTSVFPYLQIAPDAEASVRNTEMYSDIGIKKIEFANNVTVSFKKTDFDPNSLKISLDVGQGKFSEPSPGMELITGIVVNDSGTGTLTETELSEVLAGSSVNVSFSITEQSFRLNGSSLTKDVEVLFQLLYATIQDPGFRMSAYVQGQNKIKQMYDRLDNDIYGVVQSKVSRFLANGDPRVGLPPHESVEKVSLEDIRKWILPQFQNGSLEIAIVGDFDEGKIEKLVEKYFGTLPERNPIGPMASTLTFPHGRHLNAEVDSSVEKSIVIVAWPTADMWDIKRTRRLHVLAKIFSERLRLEVREKLGASYAPRVYSAPGILYRGYGKLMVEIVVAPGMEKEIRDVILTVAHSLSHEGISSVEVERVVGPLMNSLRDTVKSNDYWLNSVMIQAARYPQKFEWPKTMKEDYASISSMEIEALAKKYLTETAKATAEVVSVQPAAEGE